MTRVMFPPVWGDSQQPCFHPHVACSSEIPNLERPRLRRRFQHWLLHVAVTTRGVVAIGMEKVYGLQRNTQKQIGWKPWVVSSAYQKNKPNFIQSNYLTAMVKPPEFGHMTQHVLRFDGWSLQRQSIGQLCMLKVSNLEFQQFVRVIFQVMGFDLRNEIRASGGIRYDLLKKQFDV